MAYKELDLDNLIEIDSVSSFISEVKALRESADGTSTEWYFRGQEADFWDIEPSVFRNDMLSIEHKLMQIPLQKIPMEFKEFSTLFDIMTKYQHYGMCTRLLDLTTNPLVALYFACKIHGNEEYESDDEKVEKEPYGVIYYTNNYYPSQSTDKEVKIVSALASYDLSKENTISEILERLRQNQIIDIETKDRWLQKTYFPEFVKLIQNNYMVTPTYTNERLRKQSGVFLLASLFTIVSGSEVGNSIITKSKGNLREEFSERFFYINGENKESILKELDLYNINEATLFPELEHQLNYIRFVNKEHVQSVSDFSKYGEKVENNNLSISLDDDNELNNHLTKNMGNILCNVVSSEDFEEIKSIIQNSFTIDWYKRNNELSKMKMAITGYYCAKNKDKIESKEKANTIINKINDEVKKYISSHIESGE